MIDPCPCGGYESHTTYAECCQPFHTGKGYPQTPEQLMRSRYSAFCKQDAAYLVESLHSSQRSANLQAELEASFANTQWQSLRIVSSKQQGSEGWVEFVAFYLAKSAQQSTSSSEQALTTPEQLHEHSRFVIEDERWRYIDGKHLAAIKLGRNDDCWCGSGKKLKKCHS